MDLSVEDFKELLLANYLVNKELGLLKQATANAVEKASNDDDQD